MTLPTNAVSVSNMSWRAWLLWVVVCALEPVLYAVAVTAFGKPILPADPTAAMLYWGVGALIFVSLPLPTFLQWIALRRIAPSLKWWVWCLGMSIAGLVAVGLPFAGFDLQKVLRTFEIAAKTNRVEPTDFGALPWVQLTAQTLAFSVAVVFVPSLILARQTSYRWYAFVLTAFCGTFLANLAEWSYGMYFFRMKDRSLNGLDFISRFNEVGFRAGIGAVWGAVTATTLAFLGRRATTVPLSPTEHHWGGQPVAMLLATAAMAMLSPLMFYSIGDQGVRAGFPAVRKVFSFAPVQDKSTGEPILVEPHDADFSAPSYPVVKFAPDGKTFVVLSADRTVTRIQVSSGANLGQIGETLGQHEQYEIDWSADGRYMVLRTDGDNIPQPNTVYSRHLNRFRLFSIPNYQIVFDYSYRDGECFHSSRGMGKFAADGKSLWVRCAQFHSSPHTAFDVIAIQLEIPSMKERSVIRYGAHMVDGDAHGIARIGADMAYWQWRRTASDSLFVRSLLTGQDIVVLHDLSHRHLAGGLTSQNVQISDRKIELRYCGKSSEVSNPAVADAPGGVNTFCRTLTFGIPSGVLEKKHDDAPSNTVTTVEVADPLERLKIKGTWSNADTTGEVVVKDFATGRERQRLVSYVQRPLAFSPDGGWLVTHVLDTGKLRIYRVVQ